MRRYFQIESRAARAAMLSAAIVSTLFMADWNGPQLATADASDPGALVSREPKPAREPDPAPRSSGSPDSILSAIETLESAHDATCHSSAGRFQDFLFGTPLSAGARHANVELQIIGQGKHFQRAAGRLDNELIVKPGQ